MFRHVFRIDGVENCGILHETIEEATNCEAEYWDWEWEMRQPWCSHCDGLGHTAFSCTAPVW